MSRSSKNQVIVREDNVTLHTLFGQCQTGSMPAAAGMLIQAFGLHDWRGWFEPFPGPSTHGQFGRDSAFIPWTKKLPEVDKTPPLAEIRIGGYLPEQKGYGGCHLVQDDELGIRWLALAEAPFEVAGTKSETYETVRRWYPVLQRADAEVRFFMDQPEWLNNTELELIEYWRDERVYAWLVVDVKEQAQGGSNAGRKD